MINFTKTETDSDGNVTYGFDALAIDFAQSLDDAETISDDSDYVFELYISLVSNRTDILCEYCDQTDFANRPFLYQSDGHYGFHYCFEHTNPTAQKIILDKITSL
jgi:hypothetical protein